MIECDMSANELHHLIQAYLADMLPGDLRRQLEDRLRTDPEAAEAFARLAPEEVSVEDLMVGPWRRSLNLLEGNQAPGRRLWLMSLLATAAVVGRVASLTGERYGGGHGDRQPEPGAGGMTPAS